MSSSNIKIKSVSLIPDKDLSAMVPNENDEIVYAEIKRKAETSETQQSNNEQQNGEPKDDNKIS